MLEIGKLVEEFYKKAALFQAPPQMIQSLARFAQEAYAAAVIFNAANEVEVLKKLHPTKYSGRIKEANQVIEAAKQYSRRPRAALPQMKLLPVNLDNWPYANKIKPEQHTTIPEFINCYILFQEKAKDAGGYKPDTNEIKVVAQHYSNPTLRVFYDEISELYSTARHELEHFSQMLLSRLLQLQVEPKYYAGEKGRLAGIPGRRYQSVDSDVWGRNFYQPIPTRIKDEKQIDHELRDNEFYTNLADSINMFKRALVNMPPEYKLEFAKLWVGERNNVKNMLKQERDQNKIKRIMDTLFIYKNVYGQGSGFHTRQPFQALLEDQNNKENRLARFIGLEDPKNRKGLLKQLKNMRKDNKYRKAVRIFYAEVNPWVEGTIV